MRSIMKWILLGLLLAVHPAVAQISNDLNVVLIICDDLNDYEGFFGGHPQALTPNMDALASSGITFINAHSSAPICAPSRSSFMTGIYPHTSGNYAFGTWYNNTVLQNSKTLMHYFRDNGYGSFGTGKIMHHRLESEWTQYGAKASAGPVAFDGTNPAFHPGVPSPFNEIGLLNGTFGSLTNIPTVNGYTGWYKSSWTGAGVYNYVDDNNRDLMQDEEVSNWASNKIALLDALGTETNFFLTVGFSNPHTPLVAPQLYFDLFPTNTLLLPASLSNDVADCYFQDNLGTNTTGQVAYRAMQESWPTFEAGLKLYLQAYLACTAFVDDQVGKVVDAVDASGFASNTVVILTSDHGYDFGEKESIAKNTLWENSTRVPMVFRVPGLEANAGKTVDDPVGLIDLYPTIKDLCGLTGDTKKNASGADLDGHSMKPLLIDPDAGTWSGPDVALSMLNGSGLVPKEQNYAVRSKTWRYIRYENGDEELYDVANDPHEWTNVVDSEDSATQAKHTELQAELFALIPELATPVVNLLNESGFNDQTGSYPDAGTAPWFAIGEGNVWSFQARNNYAYEGSHATVFNQDWDAGSIVQNLDTQLDTNAIYEASFWMLSHTPGGGTNPSAVDVELFTSATSNGTYFKRGSFVADAINTTSNIWEQFSGTITGAVLTAHADEYIQFRITKPNGSTTHLISIDAVSLTAGVNAPEPPPFTNTGSIVSVNIHHAAAPSGNYDLETLATNETYGVASLNTVVGNWNNTNAAMSNLRWDNGQASTVGFTKSTGTYASWKTAHDNTPLRAGAVAWLISTANVSLNNLNANFTNGYAAIVYLSGSESNTCARISNGSETYYYQTANPASDELVRMTDTNPTDGCEFGSYAVFGNAANPLTNDTISFTLNGVEGAAVFMGGVQIVDAAMIPHRDPPLADLQLIDFDGIYNPSQLTVDEGTATVVSSNGNSALQLTAAAGERVKLRLTPDSGTWNLVDYVNLAMDFENLGGDEAWIRILIKDPSTATESWYRPNCSHSAWVQPGETRVFPALMPRLRSAPGNDPGYINLFFGTGLPHAQMLAWYGIDVSQVSEVILQLEPQDYAQTVRIDNLRGNRRAKPTLLDTNPNAFFPFVDGYGQYIHEDWPGKVTADADLLAAKAAEEADLAANPRTMEYNEYGGWANGPTLPATGHFRTEKIDGKWWFVDPAGKMYWSLGATGIGLTEMQINLDGEEHFYSDLPARDDPVFGAFYTPSGAGAPTGDYFKSFYPVLYKKYGSNFETTYNDRALERIRSWGLNSLGAWSAAANNQTAGLKTPYTKIFWTPGKEIPAVPKLDDPFDSNFSNAVVTAIGWTGSANDPYCIGFFDNNEITWGSNPEQVTRNIMEDSDGTVAAKVELVNNLQAEYGSIAAANAAWGSSFASFNDLLPALGDGSFSYAGAAASMEAFYAHLTDTYYRKCREAMKSAAPNKLYLGSRIYEGSMRKEVAAAAAAHCDVVSFNVYHKDLDEFQGMKARDLPFFTEDKPYLVGEFTFGSLDRGKFWTGIEYAADQRNRGEAYIRFIESGLNDPRCIGAHWFAYDDGATAGHYKPNVSENAAKGLIDSTDTPYYELISAIRATGAAMYAYRFADSVYEASPLLADWQFNGPAGGISTATNDAGLAVWSDDTDWTLNGSGQASVSGEVAEQNASPFASVTNGSVFMRIDYSAWSFDDFSQTRAGFELDNQELYVRLRGRVNNPFFGIGTANHQTVAAVSSNGMSIIVGVDLDADACSLWWDDGRKGIYAPVYTNAALGTAAAAVVAPYFRNTQFAGSNPIEIDMLLYGTNFTDLATFGLSPYALWIASYQLSGTDDDFDGLDNLAEFALGGNPTNPGENGYLPTLERGGSNLVYVYPRRKDAGLLYWLETSTNLVANVWTNSGYTECSVHGNIDADFDAVTNELPFLEPQSFIRLKIQEQ